jgi:hypothetical protein
MRWKSSARAIGAKATAQHRLLFLFAGIPA